MVENVPRSGRRQTVNAVGWDQVGNDRESLLLLRFLLLLLSLLLLLLLLFSGDVGEEAVLNVWRFSTLRRCCGAPHGSEVKDTQIGESAQKKR